MDYHDSELLQLNFLIADNWLASRLACRRAHGRRSRHHPHSVWPRVQQAHRLLGKRLWEYEHKRRGWKLDCLVRMGSVVVYIQPRHQLIKLYHGVDVERVGSVANYIQLRNQLIELYHILERVGSIDDFVGFHVNSHTQLRVARLGSGVQQLVRLFKFFLGGLDTIQHRHHFRVHTDRRAHPSITNTSICDIRRLGQRIVIERFADRDRVGNGRCRCLVERSFPSVVQRYLCFAVGCYLHGCSFEQR